MMAYPGQVYKATSTATATISPTDSTESFTIYVVVQQAPEHPPIDPADIEGKRIDPPEVIQLLWPLPKNSIPSREIWNRKLPRTCKGPRGPPVSLFSNSLTTRKSFCRATGSPAVFVYTGHLWPIRYSNALALPSRKRRRQLSGKAPSVKSSSTSGKLAAAASKPARSRRSSPDMRLAVLARH